MSEIPLFSSSDELERFLQEKGVDTSLYGKGSAKDVLDLFSELESGEVNLSFDEQSERIMRVVRVLNIDVLHGERVLYEAKQVFKDEQGNETNRERVRDHLKVAVSEKIGPDEDATEGVFRAIKEELGIILGEDQLGEDIDIKEEELESPSFPQIWTVYQILTTSVELTEGQFNSGGYREEQTKKNTYFEWDTIEKIEQGSEVNPYYIPDSAFRVVFTEPFEKIPFNVYAGLAATRKFAQSKKGPLTKCIQIIDAKGEVVERIY